MSLFDLIPTCDDPMSQYSLVAFALYALALIILGRCCVKRMDKHELDAESSRKVNTKMQTDVAVMTESIKNIERDGQETRMAIAEINRTLRGKLT